MDMDLGLHKAASHYYYPGFHEPGTGLTVGINKPLWERLDASDRRLIEEAAAAEYTRGVAEFSAKNALVLRTLRDEGWINILQFDNTVLKAISRQRARTLSPKQAKATSFPGKFTPVISSSAH